MTPVPESPADQAHRDEVLAWFMRRGQAGWSADDEAALQQWLDADAARAAAWARWTGHWQVLDAATPEMVAALRGRLAIDKARECAAPSARPAVGLRRRVVPVLACAALATVAGGAALLAWNHGQAQPVYAQQFSTPRGQQAEVQLPDGSRLRLGTATRLEVTYYRSARELRLIDGEAWFQVQPAPDRPFRVRAAGVEATALGTRYSVRHTPGIPGGAGVRVAVEEGQVRVAAAGAGPAAQQTVLLAGQQVEADAAGVLAAVAGVPSEGVAPWRFHRVSFVDTPLASALAELERYGNTGLWVRDPGVAALRLSGTFDPRDTQTLRRVLPLALPLRLRADGDRAELVPAR